MNRLILAVSLLAVLAAQSGPASADPGAGNFPAAENASIARSDPGDQPTDQIIIKYRDVSFAADSVNQLKRLSGAARAAAVQADAGLAYAHKMSGGAHVMRLKEKLPYGQVEKIAARLAALPEVEYAEPDAIDFPAFVPNDPNYTSQWNYFQPAANNWGVNAPAAWDITNGSGVVVAVIDTGITNHADLAGQTVPGYDFIADTSVSNDGDGRDADPSDPGDWIPGGASSSWHGTHTAGTIAAISNNNIGVAGVAWGAKILPVRVLGRGGGYTSDIVDGMRWAAGLFVAGVPANTHPAKVLSLSLGGNHACSNAEQSAVNDVTAAGATVVVAAGNSHADASTFSPASCDGVITVAATNRSGNKASYSNDGSSVEISGPGGESGTDGVLSTMNSGETTPGSDTYGYLDGTSMATPHVSAVAALIYSLAPEATPAQVLHLIQSTATRFPAGSSCNTSICGSGIVNAGAAVTAGTFTQILSVTPDPAEVGQDVTVKYSVAALSGGTQPTGTVTVKTAGASCTGTVAGGQCTLKVTTGGIKTFKAAYSGDGSYVDSISTELSISVQGGGVIYLPMIGDVISSYPFIGVVHDNGALAAGQTVYLDYYDGTAWNSYASASTNADGSFVFPTTPVLDDPAKKFYVYWRNASYHTDWLWNFACSEVTASSQDYFCNINIHDIALRSPQDGDSVGNPATFTWTTRGPSSDNYVFRLYDGVTLVTEVPNLGNVSSATIGFTGGSTGHAYSWEIDVNTPDGFGRCLGFPTIYFNNMAGAAGSDNNSIEAALGVTGLPSAQNNVPPGSEKGR